MKEGDLRWSLARKLELQNPQVNFRNLFIPSGPSIQRTLGNSSYFTLSRNNLL